jgi:RecB family exonuclease
MRHIDTDFILQSLTTKGFSATSFNNCVANPWDYVYRNVLRVPEVQATHLQFGTAIHAVLESATRYHTEYGVLPNATAIKNKLEQALARLPFSTNEFVRHLELGLTMLYPYLEHIEQSLPAKTVEELSIKVVLQTGLPELPLLPLTGNLDRLDIGTDGRAYRVVDYKTGKPKTRNDIEGKTVSSDGAYKRQLVFYTLLLSLYDDDRYKTSTGVLSFVQSAARGAVKEEVFMIDAAEVEALRLQIIETVRQLLIGDFLHDKDLAAQSKYPSLALALLGQ